MNIFQLHPRQQLVGDDGIPFGIDPVVLADQLELFAKLLRLGRVLPQSTSNVLNSSVQDFEMQTISITYVEKAK